MQRFSTLATLFLFMIVLSWAATSVQQGQQPLQLEDNSNSLSEPTPYSEETTPARISIPNRNADSLLESGLSAELSESGLPVEDLVNHAQYETAKEDQKIVSTPDGLHFLLLGSRRENRVVDLIMVATLVAGKEAHLTAIDPDLPIALQDNTIPLGTLLTVGGSYNDFSLAAELVTGLKPQFYIDLNLDGFSEMIALLGGIEHEGGASFETATTLFGGADIIKTMVNRDIPTGDKEALVISMLIAARDVDNTSLGLALLWTGYQNLRTNLGLNDLLQVRRVTQDISPTRVILHEIKP